MAPAGRSRASGTANVASRGPITLPNYQPTEHPLNENAQHALHDLPRNHKLDSLKHKFRAANGHLTQAAADINDRFQIHDVQNEKRKARKTTQSSQDSHGEEDKVLDEMRQRTNDMTQSLEGSVRKIIDASEELAGVERALKELDSNVTAGRGVLAPTQSTLGTSQFRQNQRRRVADPDDEDSDVEEEPPTDGENALESLKKRIGKHRAAQQALSMADRYASHNDYVGFKKIVHDAQYPGDQAPPMPGASTWFPSYHSGTQTAVEGAQPGTQAIEDDDDFEVASERISIKCPITLLPMKHPVSSKKCPHSFEKEAILSMINASEIWEETPSNGRRGATNGPKAMKCPVCEVLLTVLDLHDDPVLVRKIKRILAAEAAENEEPSDEEDHRPAKSTQRRDEITSSPGASVSSRVKGEAVSQMQADPGRDISVVPNTQPEGYRQEDYTEE